MVNSTKSCHGLPHEFVMDHVMPLFCFFFFFCFYDVYKIEDVLERFTYKAVL